MRNQMRYIVSVILLVAALFLGYSLLRSDNKGAPTEQEQAEGTEAVQFTSEMAQGLAEEAWGTCENECDEMHVEHLKYDGVDHVVATYEGLQDDSVRAMLYDAPVTLNEDTGEWSIGEAEQSWKCHAGRGSQEWTTELCL